MAEKKRSVIVNKHIDSRSEISKYLETKNTESGEIIAPEKPITDLIDTREDYKKGEIVVVNDPNDPSLYVLDTNDKLRKIAGSGTGYDDYELREWISGNTEDISKLQETKLDKGDFTVFETDINNRLSADEAAISGNTATVSAHTTHIQTIQQELTGITESIGTINSGITDLNTAIEVINGDSAKEGSIAYAIADMKSKIDEYTVNSKKVSENPILTSSDLLIGDDYSFINAKASDIIAGQILTEAIASLEKTLANTMLAVAASLNDLEMRLGVPTEYDENGNVSTNGYGLALKVQEIEKQIASYHTSE